MKLELMLIYNGGNAFYKIHQEEVGIFTAYLISFDGKATQAPPEIITLVKSVRNWTGSAEDDSLIRDLGDLIDSYYSQTHNDEAHI